MSACTCLNLNDLQPHESSIDPLCPIHGPAFQREQARAERDGFPADFGHGDDINVEMVRLIAKELDPGRGNVELRCDGTPEGSKIDNDLRAAWAFLGLEAYVRRTFGTAEDESFETLIPDLMSDLMHLCDAVHLDVEYALDKARRQYEEELDGVL